MRGTGRKGRYPKFTHIHIDCDPLVYKIGFAFEKATHLTEDDTEFKTMSDAVEYCKGMGLDPNTITKQIVPQPWKEVRTELKKRIRKYQNLFSASKTHLYLSPKSYFRHHLVDFYKTQRAGTKPYHYDKIREFFMQQGAKLVVGMEADDTVAINHFYLWKKAGGKKAKRVSLIVGEDKDFNNVPGWHYNPGKDTLYYVTGSDAIAHFYSQMLMGDSADNIPGIPGKGAAFAKKHIPEYGNKGVDEKELYSIVRGHYLTWGEKEGKTEDETIDYMLANAHLLWILWEKDGFFVPPLEEDVCRNLKWLEKLNTLKKEGEL